MDARLNIVLVMAVLLAAVSPITAQVPLTPLPVWQSAEPNMYSTGMIWRDGNNDGYIDVFYSNGNDIVRAQNTVYFSDHGALPDAASWLSANYEYSGHCAVGDINDDGWADFAVANFLGAGGFSTPNRSNLYLNTAGTISASPNWYTGDSIYSFSCAFGDADGDGDLDLALATGEPYGSRKYKDRIYYNNGGIFESLPGWQSGALTEAMDVTWGDVDNDGDLDLAFAYNDRPPTVFRNNAGIIETSPSWQAYDNESANTVIFGDVNRDGWLDLVVAFNSQLGGTGYFRVYYNNGAGVLNQTCGWQSATGGYGSAVALYDTDNDGDDDLAAGRWWETPMVYLNTGTTFTAMPVWQAGVETVVEELAWVDVDGSSVRHLADTVFVVAGKKVFYTVHHPLHAVDSVVVDGVRLDNPDFCYDLVSGWVALSAAPADSIVIFYQYSTNCDLAVSNWEPFNMVFGNMENLLVLDSLSFDDQLWGDGDGRPESGETVQLLLTIGNGGTETASGVSLSLTCDDASIDITDGWSNLGDILPSGSASTAGDPVSFTVPDPYISRIDSFFIELTWNDGRSVDTMALEQIVGPSPILLVDDDNSDTLETHYAGYLNRHRIPWDRWNAAAAAPDSALMVSYDLAIWFTGDYRADPLTSAEISAMRGCLDGDGKLFVAGQGIAAQLNSLDPAFLSNYLHATYQSTMMYPVLDREPGSQVFNSSFSIAIQGGGGASNQTKPDFIQPANGGVPDLRFKGQSDFGAVSYVGSQQMLFFSFGFEAIASGDYRWRDRDSLYSDILDYFAISRPGQSPMALDLTVSPGDSTHLIDHTPEIMWTYYDPELSLQEKYQIQVGDDTDWDSVEVWNSGIISGSETQTTYAGAPLVDGARYYYRVRVFDGMLWSAWAGASFRMNSLPAAPTAMNPAQMQGVTSTMPTLSHANSVDAEKDKSTYAYEVYADPEMTILVAQADDYPQGSGTTTAWPVPVTLNEDEDYYWRVRAHDGFEDGPWAGPAAFWVNAVNQLPAAFTLLVPDSGVVIGDQTPAFAWTIAADADPYDLVHYTLTYATNPLFTDATSIPGLDTTCHTPVQPLAAGKTFYWKVLASDQFAGQRYSADTFSFRISVWGDANGNGQVEVGDAVFLINYVFKYGPPPAPYESGDANCDGTVNVGDPVFIINYVFRGGPPPICP